MKDYVYVGNVIKCIAALPNGNEVRIERLAGEELPEIGAQIFLYWKREDAVLIHNKDQLVFQTLENVTWN